jgi:hypothetical protein
MDSRFKDTILRKSALKMDAAKADFRGKLTGYFEACKAGKCFLR